MHLNYQLPLFAMNAGSGPYSYVQNSSYQRGALDVAKSIIEEEILTKLNIKHLVKNGVFIADFGCSTGLNSFPAMEIITQAIHHKLHETAEYYVFFNDVASNDFNTIFTSLPPHRSYHALAVPGDFHGRLLPDSSLHFAYSSWSLHWLRQVPEVVADSTSPAWNKGAILYTENRKEVCDAYFDQFCNDMNAFLESRAVEMVGGGLMALLLPAVPQVWNPQTDYTIPCNLNLLGSCLMEMAKKGRLSEAKIDSFNIPQYFTTPQQLKAILERSHMSFSIERIEIIENHGKYSVQSADDRARFYRAVFERLLTHHFGSEIINELFDLFKTKLEASPLLFNTHNDKSIVILAMLKRKTD
ncbi:hypothetical protein ACS0TY_034234 [Phlomoides rotata]